MCVWGGGGCPDLLTSASLFFPNIQKSRELVETIDAPQIDCCSIWAAS